MSVARYNNHAPMNLTDREIHLIRELAAGKRSSELAAEHECTEAAVSYWLRNARRVSGAKTNFQLIAMAVKEGVVQ